MLVKEINRPLQVGYTIKHTYVAWQGVYALIFNPRKEVEESLEYEDCALSVLNTLDGGDERAVAYLRS